MRDALIKLAKEGLVDVIPQKGTSVSKIDLKRVEEERFLRESLELRAIEIFIGIQKETDIARMRSILDIQKECATKMIYSLFRNMMTSSIESFLSPPKKRPAGISYKACRVITGASD